MHVQRECADELCQLKREQKCQKPSFDGKKGENPVAKKVSQSDPALAIEFWLSGLTKV